MRYLENLNFKFVKIFNGFWKNRFDLNRRVSLKAVYERFEQSGRFDALRFNYEEGKAFPHVYYDSDVAKWIEAVGYLIECDGGGYDNEQKVIDELVQSMEKHQLPDGYLNSHFIQIEPEKRFTDRNEHELYCAGHLIEAAIAYDRATGKGKFLDVIKKYVDCIEKCFMLERTATYYTCGHEEIELALVKLYDYTKTKKYLDLALFFINSRGVEDEEAIANEVYNKKHDQSEVPVRDLAFAEGHAVRAVYLYIAMAELALRVNDEKLFAACKRIWRDIVDKKMYITGGIGSSKLGEAFTVAYNLPNLEAYSESCASIGLALFALSMQKMELNAEYGAVIERIMYNGLLSSTSLDGKSFFYENPLEIHTASVDIETSAQPRYRRQLPIRHRLEIFDCSCCPPNINRIFARIGDFFFSKTDDALVINQFGSVAYQDEKNDVIIKTNYPNDGKICIEVNKCDHKEILVRIPEWCDDYATNVEHIEKAGYISFSSMNRSIEIDFNMKPYFVECNPKVRDNAGKVALCYGPLVYCLERLDNDYELNALSIDVNTPINIGEISEEYGLPELTMTATLSKGFSSLYRKASDHSTQTVNLSFRPYWTFANRDECDMLIWIKRDY